MNNTSASLLQPRPNSRLASLDILRGFDLFPAGLFSNRFSWIWDGI